MNPIRGLITAAALVAAVNAQANITYFDSNFDSAVDTGPITDGPYQLSTVFGNPSLVSGTLAFNLADAANGYEQVRLNMGSSLKSYQIEFDVLTQNLANSAHSFSMTIDTPTVQTLNFNNCCYNAISTFNTNTSSPTSNITSLIDNAWMHVSIEVDLLQDLWSVIISRYGASYSLIDDPFYSSGGGIESIRFNLSPAKGGTLPDSNINVFLDNLSVTATVPVPAAAWLFGASLLGLVIPASRRR